MAPTLLPYEVTQAVLKAVRRNRLAAERSGGFLAAFRKLHIATYDVDMSEVFAMARLHNRSAYDAAYLTLAQQLGVFLITADRRLYGAVAAKLPWVIWIGNWRQKLPLAGMPS